MNIRNLLAEISREFFKMHKVTRYRMKKVSEMNDEDVIKALDNLSSEELRTMFTELGNLKIVDIYLLILL